eukprot:TRINITY_DN25340_c1_g1_i4.p2 TRINITY_DN25340_c1_g1~~TRINITY_DN25340_c1_g1_i4.p2  ORF type:complete len:114 (-),score=10.48 TRINITY_DN25340_c1_g1_i4:342-683(-)
MRNAFMMVEHVMPDSLWTMGDLEHVCGATFMWKRCGKSGFFFVAEFGLVQRKSTKNGLNFLLLFVEEEKVYSVSFLWMYTNMPLLICLWMLIISKSFGVPSTLTRLLQESGWW